MPLQWGTLVLAVTLAFATPTVHAAQAPQSPGAYPVKPIRFIAPFPPGGTSDLVARLVAQKLTDTLGKQVLVDNRGGASGTIGYEIAARAQPDGYTLLLTSMGGLVTNQFLFRKLPFDPMNDFAHVSQLVTAGQVLIVHPSVPAQNVGELIALARAKPGQLNVGSGGLGTTQHIVSEVFQNATGVKFTHVPYKGSVLAVAATVAGQIQLVFSDMAPSVPQVKAGKVRALAVSSEQRSAALPDTPTLAESGVKTWFPQTWWAVSVPKGTPRSVIERLNTEIGTLLQAPEVQERLAHAGLTPLHSTPERVHEVVKTGAARMGQLVKTAGITPD